MKRQSILVGIAAAIFVAPTSAATTTAAGSSTATSALSNSPSEEPVIGQITDQGCWNSSLGLTLVDEDLDYNSDGKCGQLCADKDYNVAATSGGQECWCGDEYPPEENIVDDAECNIGCTGFKDVACGGLDTWSVYNVGNKLAVHYHDPAVASSSTGTASASASKTSAAGSTSTSSQSSDTEESSDNSKTIGVAVGVVSAIIIVGGAVGGVFWYIRKKRNQEIEEEHRRNAAVNAFINGTNAPESSHGSISMTDSRLDPVMAHRRLSDGSIADNQDYSRKILRVTNA